MAAQAPGEPQGYVSGSLPLLGFNHVVAPIYKTARTPHPLFSGATFQGDVPKLPRDLDVCAKVAPHLSVVLRKILEDKQIQPETVQYCLGHSPSLKRYDSAFRLLWAILQDWGDPQTATLDEVAQGILKLHKFSSAQARSAYSSMLLLPGYNSLRFHVWLQLPKNYGTQFKIWSATAPSGTVCSFFKKWLLSTSIPAT